MTKADFSGLSESRPYPYVPRQLVDKFSGGILNPRTMANMDSKGLGPPKVRVGKMIVYPVDLLIEWMEERSEVIE